MFLQADKSKLRRAVVITPTNFNYFGIISIDVNRTEGSGFKKGEFQQVVNNNKRERFETYLINAEQNSGHISFSREARKAGTGDFNIVIPYALRPSEENNDFQPITIYIDKNIKINY